jgi:hypothetical protein
MRDLLGPSLSMERAAAFAREILSRRIAGADARRAVACTGIPTSAANVPSGVQATWSMYERSTSVRLQDCCTG